MYKIHFFSDFAGHILFPVLINVLFWKGMADSNVLDYSFVDLMVYIIMANLVMSLSQVAIEQKLSNDIRSYKLAQQLLIPVSYHKKVAIETISSGLVRFLFVYLPLVILILILYGKMNLLFFILGIISILFSFILNFLISAILGEFSFWLTEVWGIAAIKNLVFVVFSGAMFPLDILPVNILIAFKFLPFSYMSYVPTKILFGNYPFEGIFHSYIIASAWCLILFCIERNIWKFGLRKYESCGA